MGNRRSQTLVALLLAAVWGAGVWIGHTNGYLPALDRVESTLTDLRTLARGIKAPPGVVTIVAIDDDMVKHGSTYPLARIDLAKIIDAIAQLKPKVIAVDLLLVLEGEQHFSTAR
jgi:adenylate cyclase